MNALICVCERAGDEGVCQLACTCVYTSPEVCVCACECTSIYIYTYIRRRAYKYSRRRGAICPGHLASPPGLPDCNPITSRTLSLSRSAIAYI